MTSADFALVCWEINYNQVKLSENHRTKCPALEFSVGQIPKVISTPAGVEEHIWGERGALPYSRQRQLLSTFM